MANHSKRSTHYATLAGRMDFPTNIQDLQAVARALHAAAANSASANTQTASVADITAQISAIEANLTALRADMRAADPETRRLVAAAITLPEDSEPSNTENPPLPTSSSTSSSSGKRAGPTPPPPIPPRPERITAKSPLSFPGRPPLAPGAPEDGSLSARASTSANPPPLHPVSSGAISALQRSAFASPRGATSPHLPLSATGTPRGDYCSSAGHTSPHFPPAPPPSLAWDQSPRRDSLAQALTPTNSLAGSHISDRTSLMDCASSARSTSDAVSRESMLALQLCHRLNAIRPPTPATTGLQEALLKMGLSQQPSLKEQQVSELHNGPQ